MKTTKRRIFEIATQLFAQKGYEATSIEEITSVVGVAKGTLYYHFISKEELFNELVDDGVEFLKKSIDIKIRNMDNPIDKLRRVITTQIRVAKKYDKFMIIIFAQLWGREDRNYFVREKVYSYIDKIEEIVIEGIEKGLIKNKNSKVVTDMIFSQFAPILMYKLENNQEVDADKLTNQYLDVILNGII